MISISNKKKIEKKQKRCQQILSKEIDIKFSKNPTTNLVICNAGLATGLKQELLVSRVIKYGRLQHVHMIPGKSYCFLTFTDITDSVSVYTEMHGKSKLGQNECVLNMSYSENLPLTMLHLWDETPPPGLVILKDFITENQETEFINLIDWNKESSVQEGKILKHRQVKHFGYEFIYGTNNIDKSKPLMKKIPVEFDILWNKLKDILPNLQWHKPDQMTANRYEPGQGIPPHVDTHSAFLNTILSLSLCSNVVMEFRNLNGKRSLINIPRRSLLVMSDESRYNWTHGITPRMMDFTTCNDGSGLTTYKRDIRISFTFRRLRDSPCNCIYPKLCDTFKQQNVSDLNDTELQTKIAVELELESVHKVYDKIGNHFSETRHSPWPKIEQFIQSLLPGSIIIDIGCGNGKYLGLNKNIFMIGCDRSESLLKVCNEREFNIFQSDCLQLPIKSESVDACISIAVIHHLSSMKRRLKAIKEMSRILVKGGKGLIYVWAKNQQANNNKSSYLKQNTKSNIKNLELNENQKELIETIKISTVTLPIHTNRTEFKHQDVFVPWKLKKNKINGNSENDEKIFLRYYHVFDENELEKLCHMCENIQIQQSYYDQGNWCIVFEKT